MLTLRSMRHMKPLLWTSATRWSVAPQLLNPVLRRPAMIRISRWLCKRRRQPGMLYVVMLVVPCWPAVRLWPLMLLLLHLCLAVFDTLCAVKRAHLMPQLLSCSNAMCFIHFQVLWCVFSFVCRALTFVVLPRLLSAKFSLWSFSLYSSGMKIQWEFASILLKFRFP